MNRFFATILLSSVICPASVYASQLIWGGGNRAVISIVPSNTTGLAEICVAYGMEGRSVSFPASSAADVKWYRYSNLGAGFAEEISGAVFADGLSTLTKVEGDMGYVVETGGRQYCFWVVDYLRHPFSVTSITESSERDCDFTRLDVDGTGAEIPYYGVNGRRFVLDREISLAYRTLVPDVENMTFIETRREVSLESLDNPLRVEGVFCPTDFVITGDRFLREWNDAVEYTSPVIQPYSVSAITSAAQTERENDNEVNPGSGDASFGGSAPCEVSFEAAVTDGALFREWQLSRFEDFDVINLSFQDLKFDYTFTEEGTTYVRFVCANSDGSCEHHSDIYTISVGASSLKCPNAFSPNGDGINDEWKVSYSGIISFECSIFDRYGHKMISFSDPSQGWDGKHNGKNVPSGAYYYVIKARGADGKDYKLSGDINIVNYSK